MLNRGFFLDALRKRIVFKQLSRKEMLRLSEEINEFEKKYFQMESVPDTVVLKFVRNNIRQQISELLETADSTRLIVSKFKNRELYDIWHGKLLED
jgi:hypothetical protein